MFLQRIAIIIAIRHICYKKHMIDLFDIKIYRYILFTIILSTQFLLGIMFSNKDLEEEEIKILCQLIENQNESFLTDFQTISFLLKVQEQQILDYIKSHKIQPALVKQFENELKLEYQAKGIILENKSFDQKVDDKQKNGLNQIALRGIIYE
ncbi:hypothetical protein pb186bvf_003662 [Paramecium bursaria]